MSVELSHVTKEYPGEVTALRDVSVVVPAGDQVAVVGPSGSGKTTMLTILGTLERPTTGEVRVAGHDTAQASDGQFAGLRAHRIGFVFQAFHLQESMSAVDNVATGMLYTGAALASRRALARDALRASRPRSPPRVQAQAAIRRGAPTRRDRPRAGQTAGHPARRRADRKPRFQVGRRRARTAPRTRGSDGATLVLITHDENIAAGFPRRLHMRDGEIVEDERMTSEAPAPSLSRSAPAAAPRRGCRRASCWEWHSRGCAPASCAQPSRRSGSRSELARWSLSWAFRHPRRPT